MCLKATKAKIFLAFILITIFLTSTIYLITIKSRNFQQETIINENINSLENLDSIAIYVDNQKAEDNLIPNGKYTIDLENTSCTVNGKKVEGITFEYKDGKIGVFGITQGNTKCNFYLNKIQTLADKMFEQLVPDKQPDFSSSTCETGLFIGEENNQPTYYYRGSINNNWVAFGKINDKDQLWRIVRINSNGSIRIIKQYDIDRSINNENYACDRNNDAKCVGYMYGPKGSTSSKNYEEATSNLEPSKVKTVIDEWYKTNLYNKPIGNSGKVVEDYLDIEAGFCADRSTYLYGMYNNKDINHTTGYGTQTTFYGGYARLINTKNPQFDCENKNDLFTVSETTGNGALTYPIGLITADEYIFSSSSFSCSPIPPKDSGYTTEVTMTPYMFDSDKAAVFNIDNGELLTTYINSNLRIHPVINLKADVTFTTASPENPGTKENPYIIQ